MKQRDDVNNDTAKIFQISNSFEYYWIDYCRVLDQWGVFLFYLGTMLMLVYFVLYVVYVLYVCVYRMHMCIYVYVYICGVYGCTSI